MGYEQIRSKKGGDTCPRSPLVFTPTQVNTNTPRSPAPHYRDLGNQALQRLMEAGSLQAKLKIGQPNDKYEQEADRVAHQVMRINLSEPGIQRQSTCPECMEDEEELIQTKPLAEQITPLVQRQIAPEEEEEEFIHTKGEGGTTPQVTSGMESRIQSLKSSGQPLPESTRSFFEPRFGADFSRVRVHHGAEAAYAARSVSARAFTTGKHMIFGTGQYSPGTDSGKRLLAHELSHVVQQNGNNTIMPQYIQRYEVEDCDPAENPDQTPQSVHNAHTMAMAMLNRAISASNRHSNPDVIAGALQCFKITLPLNTDRDRSLWAHVTRALSSMRVADTDTVYECEPRQSWWHGGCISGNIALALGNIHLCPLWWTLYNSANDRALLLIHEWGHKWGEGINRIFETYCWDNPAYTNLPAEELVRMPDAYANYVYQVFYGMPRTC